MKRFHQLQDEYLLIVNNDIKSVVDLVDFINEQEEKIQQIEDRQHEIYRESSSRKRSIKNEEQYREYQSLVVMRMLVILLRLIYSDLILLMLVEAYGCSRM